MSMDTADKPVFVKPGKWSNAVVIGNGGAVWRRLRQLELVNLRSTQYVTHRAGVSIDDVDNVNVVRLGEVENQMQLQRQTVNRFPVGDYQLTRMNVFASDVPVGKSTIVREIVQKSRTTKTGTKNIFIFEMFEDIPRDFYDFIDFFVFENDAMNGTDWVVIDICGDVYKW